MKVLLLNPPGQLPYQRDYYCSKVSKAGYLYHPTDLLILSGIIAERHEVMVLDALAESLPPAMALQRIAPFDPDVVISLCGAVSWGEDLPFFVRLKEWKPQLRLMVSGDLVLEGATSFPVEATVVDALLLDFTSTAVLDWLAGERGEMPGVIFRLNGVWSGRCPARDHDIHFTIPVPRHELFPEDLYRFPLLRRRSFATILTDYGCQYHCRFCVTGNLGYKWRPVENVLAELDVLAARGIRELYFNDQTFGLKRERTEALLRAMIARRYEFGWACWSRVDLVDFALLELMRQAGCHTMMFGVEAADRETLLEWGKGFEPAAVTAAMALCRQAGIRTLATFLLGLPGQDRAACLRTIDFSRSCGCDFASFNVPVPRLTTRLRQQALGQGWMKADDVIFDQSGMVTAMGNGILSAAEIMALRRLAVRNFYLRPGYLLRRLFAVRSLSEFVDLMAFGRATVG